MPEGHFETRVSDITRLLREWIDSIESLKADAEDRLRGIDDELGRFGRQVKEELIADSKTQYQELRALMVEQRKELSEMRKEMKRVSQEIGSLSSGETVAKAL